MPRCVAIVFFYYLVRISGRSFSYLARSRNYAKLRRSGTPRSALSFRFYYSKPLRSFRCASQLVKVFRGRIPECRCSSSLRVFDPQHVSIQEGTQPPVLCQDLSHDSEHGHQEIKAAPRSESLLISYVSVADPILSCIKTMSSYFT